MKLGVYVNAQHPAGDDPARRFAETVEQVRLIRSLGFDSDAVSTYYVKAAALARFNQAAAAEGVLRTALAREPGNFVTWALLGDIAVREGRMDVAQTDYARAHALKLCGWPPAECVEP